MNDTRTAAFTEARKRKGDLWDKCLGALADACLTADEVAEAVGETVLSVRPRMTELAQAKRIIKTPLRRANQSGRMAAVWMAA